MAKSVAIIYGFAEGDWHGKRLRRALTKAGYEIVQDPAKASVVLAHSGGCFEVPELTKSQALVLINPPYWPGKTKGQRGLAKIRQDIKGMSRGPDQLYHVKKFAMNFYYFITNYFRMIKIINDADEFNLEVEIKHRSTILLRNVSDPWLTPQLDKLQALNPHLKIHRLSGDHDDIWLNPTPYVNLLQSDMKEFVA